MPFITDGPHYRSFGRVGQLGDQLDQLTVEIIRRVGAVWGARRDQRHSRALPPGQAGSDVAVVVTADPGDGVGADDVAGIVLGHPHNLRAHALTPVTMAASIYQSDTTLPRRCSPPSPARPRSAANADLCHDSQTRSNHLAGPPPGSSGSRPVTGYGRVAAAASRWQVGGQRTCGSVMPSTASLAAVEAL